MSSSSLGTSSMADPVVVPADAVHQDEEDDDRGHGDPGAVDELRRELDDQHQAGEAAAEALDDARALHLAARLGVGLGLEVTGPVPHHAELAGGERDEHADDVELDQLGGAGLEVPQQQRRERRQQHDAVAVDQPVAAGVQLARQVAVAGQHRGQHREAVVRGVGRQHEDRGRDRLQEVEHRPSGRRRPCRRSAPARSAGGVLGALGGRPCVGPT